MKVKFATIFAICILTNSIAKSQSVFNNGIANIDSPNSTNNSMSVFTGGFIIKNSLLSATKLGYEYKHFGAILDFTYDTYKKKWSDDTKSRFTLYGLSISGRYYLKPLGRGPYAEINAGLMKPYLSSIENNQEKLRKGFLSSTGLGLGWRFGKRPKGLFGEIGYRTTINMKNVHLYTTDTKPDPSTIENISYQSWVFQKHKSSSQIYLGVGYSF